MAIPTVFAPVKSGDFVLRPFQVHKEYHLSSTSLISTASGYAIVEGVHTSLKTPIGSNKALNDPTNSFDGSYQHIIWQSFNHRYYKFPHDWYATFEHANKRYTYKFLNYSASMFCAPYLDYGERIKPGSVYISNSSHAFTLVDDLNGNIYDPSIDTGSFSLRYGIVGYWGFNETFKKFKYRNGTIVNGAIGYVSRVFEPDEYSYCKNVTFDTGVPINNTGSGMEARFSGQSFIITHDRPELNFTSDEDFTIAFWMQAPVTQSDDSNTSNAIISKRGVIRKNVYGVNSKYNQSDILISTMHISASIEDDLTPVYPYDIDFYNHMAGADAGKVRFRRSDGINSIELVSTGSVAGSYTHIAVVKSGTLISLYVNGLLHDSGSDPSRQPINKHSLMFGSVNRSFENAYTGSLDEVRMYDYAVSTSSLATLANNSNISMYQTAVVGNVFYRQGNIVVSPLDPKYLRVFKNNWAVVYAGTHTIYQYEVLCRVKKGSFNLSYNPTARKSPKSDLLINDMTGSLLLPYATTIGLYNDAGDLVAVAKLGQPIQMRDDVDLNFIVRWDS